MISQGRIEIRLCVIFMKYYSLVLGDMLAILIVTGIGFATHGEADISFLPRMAAAFFPLAIAWFLLAPFVGLFQPAITSNPKQLWRPVLAMVFAAPLAAVLRGLLLNAAIIPVFAVVLGATSALGMLVWRTVWYWFENRGFRRR
jgi:hypothetical protein